MKKRTGGDLTVCIVLLAILVACGFVASPFAAIVAALVAALLGAQIDRSGRLIAVRVVNLASLLLPTADRSDHADEWIDQVLCDGEAGLRPVFTALGIAFRAAPRLALRLRIGRRVFKYVGAFVLAYMEYVGIDSSNMTPPPPKKGIAALFAAALYMCAVPGLVVAAILRIRTGRRLSRRRIPVVGAGVLIMINIVGSSIALGPVRPVSALTGLICGFLVGSGHEAAKDPEAFLGRAGTMASFCLRFSPAQPDEDE